MSETHKDYAGDKFGMSETHKDYAGDKFGMWLFLFTEILLFGGLFLLYSV